MHKTTILKVLQLTKKYPWPPSDGEVQAILCNLRALKSAGCQPEVLALNTLKHHASADLQQICMQELGVKIHSSEIDTRPSLWKFLCSATSPLPFHVYRFYSRAFAEKLNTLLSRGDFDVVLLEGIYLMAYLPVLRRHRVKIALRLHNAEHEIWQRLAMNTDSFLKKQAYFYLSSSIKRFEEKQIPLADVIIPITDRDARWAAQYAKGIPHFTIPAGIETTNTTEVSSGKKVYFIGSMDWFPNHEGWIWLLRKVWPLVTEKVPDAELHLAGRNFPRDIEGHDIKAVVLHGEVPDAQAFVRSCDVLAVPLFSGSGMRLKILEALAMGKPVVSTSMGAEGIVSESSAAIQLADDAEGFASALIQILLKPELRKQAVIAAQDLHQTQSGEKVIGKKLVEALLCKEKA